MQDDGMFNAGGNLWTSLSPLSWTGPALVSNPMSDQIRLLRTLLRWDICVSPGMEMPSSNDWPIPTVKSLLLIAPWNLQRLLLCPLWHDHFTVCLWGKSLVLLSSHYTAETSSKSPADTPLSIPSSSRANPSHSLSWYIGCTSPLNILTPLSWVCSHVSLSLLCWRA